MTSIADPDSRYVEIGAWGTKEGVRYCFFLILTVKIGLRALIIKDTDSCNCLLSMFYRNDKRKLIKQLNKLCTYHNTLV